MTTKIEGQHMIALKVKNHMRVECGELRPKGKGLTLIGGANEQGKTCFLQSIPAALGGKRLVSQKPIREGEEKGEVDIELDDFIIHWEVTGERTTKLVVYSKPDGHELKKPQNILDRLFGREAFDPLAFTRMDDSKQRETMVALSPGLDDYLEELVVRRAGIFEERTEINRTTKRLEGVLTRMRGEPFFARLRDIPNESVSAETVSARIKKAEKHNQERGVNVNVLQGARNTMETVGNQIAKKEQQIAELQDEIEALAKDKLAAQSRVIELTEALEAPIDTSGLVSEYDKISEINEAVAFKRGYAETEKELTGSKGCADDLTTRIKEVDGQKHEAIKAANFPVEGIDFSDDGVLLNGLPFKQASQTEAIITSFAIGMALNPLAKFMIVYEASLMDEAHLLQLHKLAMEADVQVLAEYVTRSKADEDRCSIVFVDGIGEVTMK